MLPMNCLSAFDHFVELALKGLILHNRAKFKKRLPFQAFVPIKYTILFYIRKICLILKMMTLCPKVLGSLSTKRHQNPIETNNFFRIGASQGVGVANITMWTSNIHNIGGEFSNFEQIWMWEWRSQSDFWW